MSNLPTNVTIVRKEDQPVQRGVHYRMEKFDGAVADFMPTARAVLSNAFEAEDEFKGYYLGATGVKSSTQAIQPPYDLKTLDRLTQENNALGPCIETMVTNIEGTGFDIVRDIDKSDEHEDATDDEKISHLWDFFSEPWPGESFKTQRKAIRRDVERLGNGYLEVLRTQGGEIVFTKTVDGKMMRLVKLGPAQPKRVTVVRRGQEVSMTLMVRYRKFVQLVNGVQLIYFKEFGCPLDLDKYTGEWAPQGQRLGAQKRASEIIHFKALPDANTPYGVPRWIGQLPSVLGSRKAEEFNMDFFDNGGVPPVMIFLQGGMLATESRKAIQQAAAGRASKKNRIAVIEMEPMGSMDAPNNSKVTVERFGSEKQNDSMFEKYDERSEVRVRRAFRLPPIFMGGATDYSFASAFASYTVAEAQVFRPERDDFDEIISARLLIEMGYRGYLMKSLPLVIEDATLKLQGLELAQSTLQVDASEILDAINSAVGTDLKVSKTLRQPDWAQQVENPPAAPGGPKASIKLTASGRPQSNSDKKKPTAIPRKNPKVTKSASDIEALEEMTGIALQSGDADAIKECFAEIADLHASQSGPLIESLITKMDDPATARLFLQAAE